MVFSRRGRGFAYGLAWLVEQYRYSKLFRIVIWTLFVLWVIAVTVVLGNEYLKELKKEKEKSNIHSVA